MLETKERLLVVVFLQYIPRFVRFIPLTSELKRTAGVFAETAWAGAAYYLLWYMLASHVRSSINLYQNYLKFSIRVVELFHDLLLKLSKSHEHRNMFGVTIRVNYVSDSWSILVLICGRKV